MIELRVGVRRLWKWQSWKWLAIGLWTGVCLTLFLFLLMAMGLVLALAGAFIVAPIAGATYAVIAVPVYGVACRPNTTFGIANFLIPDGTDYITFLTGGPCPGGAVIESADVIIADPLSIFWQSWYEDLLADILDRGIDSFWGGVGSAIPYMQKMHDIPVLGAIYWAIYTISIFIIGKLLVKIVEDLYAPQK